MEDTRKELERIQHGLLEEEDPSVTLDELLADEELNSLLQEKKEPAFEDPNTIHEPETPMVYQNHANNYGAARRQQRRREQDNKIILGLMITACALSLGIIGLLAYWLNMLL